MGGISADDPQAVPKLESKLAGLEKLQEKMKAINAYFRKHKTLDGCPGLSPEQGQKLVAGMASYDRVPYPSWALSNNSAEIRRLKTRIASLTQQKARWKQILTLTGCKSSLTANPTKQQGKS